MKKISILALLLGLFVVSCASPFKDSKFVGEWYNLDTKVMTIDSAGNLTFHANKESDRTDGLSALTKDVTVEADKVKRKSESSFSGSFKDNDLTFKYEIEFETVNTGRLTIHLGGGSTIMPISKK